MEKKLHRRINARRSDFQRKVRPIVMDSLVDVTKLFKSTLKQYEAKAAEAKDEVAMEVEVEEEKSDEQVVEQPEQDMATADVIEESPPKRPRTESSAPSSENVRAATRPTT